MFVYDDLLLLRLEMGYRVLSDWLSKLYDYEKLDIYD